MNAHSARQSGNRAHRNVISVVRFSYWPVCGCEDILLRGGLNLAFVVGELYFDAW